MPIKYEIHILSGRVRQVPFDYTNRSISNLVLTASQFQTRQQCWWRRVSKSEITPISQFPKWNQKT